ncbi:Pathogenesis-related protein STH-21 [Capsicum baccatum]|uniref:Pathogenesis-related protein STH-21 n=1 Tax=Capsicum baccatum TaxID=33114 RepID=A0A2G2XC85_CAPBA|nr:Pathogenesis-related protein STH-21 [Capsicum baccatum]
MGVYTFTDETTTSVAPLWLFKALVIDCNNLVSKLAPDVKSIENVEGDGGPGTIKKITFVEGGPMKYLKHKIHVIDDKNLVTKYSLIEGDVLGDKAESVDYDAKFEASANGGCVNTTVTVYHTKCDYVVTEEEHNVHKDKANDLLKAIEAYLLANPSVYV